MEGYYELRKYSERAVKGCGRAGNLPMLREKGYDTVTPVIVTNSDDFEEITALSVGAEVTKKDKILLVKKD